MAGSDNGSNGASQLPMKLETTTTPLDYLAKLPRRQLTLIAITALLNILLWSSVICIVTVIYQLAADTDDTNMIASEVFTLTSSLATIAYIVLHTIFSLKQRIWKHQNRHPAILKRTSYIAARFAVTLCILWLLTSGWNMIIIARRPVCLSPGPGLRGWEAGAPCRVGRVGIAFAMTALLASFVLFGMLAVVRRPFEAHLLKHGYKLPSAKPNFTPSISQRPSTSRSRSASFAASDRYQGGRVSAATFRSLSSNSSNTDVDTLDLNTNSQPATIFAPAPMRSIGLGIFTSDAQPPPLPPAFAVPRRASSLGSPLPNMQPTDAHQHLPLPPRMSALVTPSGFVPLSVPAQFSASAWRAVHPPAPSPLGPAAMRSHSQLPPANSQYNVPYRSRYSRSSVSLTRPHRLSESTPAGSVACSSRSVSTGPDDGRGSPSTGSDGVERRATASEIAYAILNGLAIPGTQYISGAAPDCTLGAHGDASMSIEPQPGKLVRSSSGDLISRFSQNRSPSDDKVEVRNELEHDLKPRLSTGRLLPFRRIRSEASIPYAEVFNSVASTPRVATTVSRMPQDLKMPKTRNKSIDAVAGDQTLAMKNKQAYEDSKNKPLPKIEAL